MNNTIHNHITELEIIDYNYIDSDNISQLESVTKYITSNGAYTITPPAGKIGFDKCDIIVSVRTEEDAKYSYLHKIPVADEDGLKRIYWDDESIKYFKYNHTAYPWDAGNYELLRG